MNLSFFKKFKKTIPPLPQTIWRKPLHFIAFGFGTGTLPLAPGTFGTLIAIPLYLVLRPLPLPIYMTLVFFLTLGAMVLCQKLEKEMLVHDHPGMCIDEIIGYLITMINAPRGFFWVALGFALFRFFDIFKPWPIRDIDERVAGGIGVILDDALAGLYSMIIIQLISQVR